MRTRSRSARRLTRHVALGAVAFPILAAACASPGAPTSPPGQPYGVVAAPPLPTAAPAAAFDPSTQIADLDATTVVSLVAGEVRFSRGDGAVVTAVPVGGTLELRAVSADGSRAALFSRRPNGSHIVVVDRSSGEAEVSEFDLPGLIEPEAFATDGSLLFVIDHQATATPGTYRVRPLNLATGVLEEILGPTKLPFDDDMNGVGRRQVWAPDGSRLYTLYIRQTHRHHADERGGDEADHEGDHRAVGTDGFVHVLDLDEEWAFCLDLPAEFGAGDLATTALAVTPDGETIAVADATAGRVAFASTAELAVTRTAELPAVVLDGELHVGMTADELVIGSGDQLRWFDQRTMAPLTETINLATTIMAITSDGWSALVWTADVQRGPLAMRPPASRATRPDREAESGGEPPDSARPGDEPSWRAPDRSAQMGGREGLRPGDELR